MNAARTPVLGLFVLALALQAAPWADRAVAQEGDLLSTGITGTISSSGIDNPRFVLGFEAVQALVLDVAHSGVEAGDARKRLDGGPVSLDVLLDLELLEVRNDTLRLAYLVLTVEDQARIREVSRDFGASLADAFSERADDYQRILDAHQVSGSREELLFGLVAGMTLNWEGLRLTTELGYRAAPRAHPNGDRYLVHSEEAGADLSWRAMYSGSHSFPGPNMSFTTFGDPPSIPRVKGIPDVFFGLGDEGLESLREAPPVYGAVRSHLLHLISETLVDAGRVMVAVDAGAGTERAVGESTGLAEPRLGSTLELLEAVGYLVWTDDAYRVDVPLIRESQRPMVDSVLALGREVLTEWLRDHYPAMEERLQDLSPMRHGLPFELVFSSVWHEVFGVATGELAARGFYQDPRAAEYRFQGYVPLVWASSLYDL